MEELVEQFDLTDEEQQDLKNKGEIILKEKGMRNLKMDFLSQQQNSEIKSRKEFVCDYNNGYKIQKVFSNKLDGIYGDIYENEEDLKKEHPKSEILIGYIVYDENQNCCPDECNDWNNTIEEAKLDYLKNILGIK